MTTKAAPGVTLDGFAAELVPSDRQGSGRKVFFIVAGSMCGLPAFILAARIFDALGFTAGLAAVGIGGAISGVLGACTAWAGSRTRMGLAMLVDAILPPVGARSVKLIIALSAVGWFGVGISVLGETAAHALSRLTGVAVAPLAVAVPACLLIAAVTLRGTRGLERLGLMLIPATLAFLVLSTLLVMSQLGEATAAVATHTLSFGEAVSAVVGSYIVGIVIQPDYGRFVRRPMAAAGAAAAALGIVYPLVLTLSALASSVTHTPELISAMILLGFGVPALVILALGSGIDASASLYSGSLSLSNQLPRLPFAAIIIAATLVGLGLVLLGAETVFIPFLLVLGVSLPPLAIVMILATLTAGEAIAAPGRAARNAALTAWVAGSAVGFLTAHAAIVLTSLPTLDSLLAAVIVFGVACILLRRG